MTLHQPSQPGRTRIVSAGLRQDEAEALHRLAARRGVALNRMLREYLAPLVTLAVDLDARHTT
jgi:hypothetical protein